MIYVYSLTVHFPNVLYNVSPRHSTKKSVCLNWQRHGMQFLHNEENSSLVDRPVSIMITSTVFAYLVGKNYPEKKDVKLLKLYI